MALSVLSRIISSHGLHSMFLSLPSCCSFDNHLVFSNNLIILFVFYCNPSSISVLVLCKELFSCLCLHLFSFFDCAIFCYISWHLFNKRLQQNVLEIFKAFVASTNCFWSINHITAEKSKYNSKPMTDIPFHLLPFHDKSNC